MTVKGFQTQAQLQKYLTTSGVVKADIVAIYFDAVIAKLSNS